MSEPVVIKDGISVEAKIAGFPVADHRFIVVTHGGKAYRIDWGRIVDAKTKAVSKRRAYRVTFGSQIVKSGTSVLAEDDLKRILIGGIGK